jgi:hypothetical protein
MAHLEVPEFVADSQSTPSSATSSLTTPTQPLFIFPPVHTYETQDLFPLQPFPSEETGWFPSIAHSSQMPFPDPNPYFHIPPYQPPVNTYNGYANPLLELDGSAWPSPMGMVQPASGYSPEDSFFPRNENGGCHRMPKGKAEGLSSCLFRTQGILASRCFSGTNNSRAQTHRKIAKTASSLQGRQRP